MQLLIVTNNLVNNIWENRINSLGMSTVQVSFAREVQVDNPPDLIAYDVESQDELKAFLARYDHSIPFLVFSQNKDADIAITALDYHSKACFFLPFEEHKFRNLINEEFSKSNNKVICVSSYKGGTGVTTAAVNLAYAMSHQMGKKTLVIDAGGFANHVSLLLNTPLKYSLADISKREGRVDISLLESILSWKNDRLAIAGFGTNVESGLSITASFFANVIDVAKEIFDYTIIQTSSCSLDETTLTAIEKSSDLYLLTTMDLLAISNTKLYLDTMKFLNYPISNVHVIMNRDQSQSGHLTKDFIEKQVGIKFYYTLPNDWNLCVESISLGQSVIETNPKAPLSLAYTDLAFKIANASGEAVAKIAEDGNFLSKLQGLLDSLGAKKDSNKK